ncbi:MAG: hypothetical protein ACLVGA_16235 [Dysosmobacter sp.]
MEGKLGQPPAVLFQYKKLILAEEKAASAGGCGSSRAVFSRPALCCPYGSAAQGVFVIQT